MQHTFYVIYFIQINKNFTEKLDTLQPARPSVAYLHQEQFHTPFSFSTHHRRFSKHPHALFIDFYVYI